jgi:uncharacterized protein
MRDIVAYFSGLIFAAGLAIGGMTMPSKVIGFLDFFGAWDPSLIFVMFGAIAVFAPVVWMTRSLRRPLLVPSFSHPKAGEVDGTLLLGAAMFGIGWAIAGFCPGPAITAIGAASSTALWFVPSMAIGIVVAAFLRSRLT